MQGPPSKNDTLEEAAVKVLNTANPWLKAEYGELASSLWLDGSISAAFNAYDDPPCVPVRPARLSTVRLLASGAMPKLGKGGSLKSRQALLHSLVHTESWAVDLSWDIIARFGRKEAMPREFFNDFARVAQDESRHFQLLVTRLVELGSHYGAFPAHDGLWDSAESTANSLSARLAIEHCVHEARGLDVLPTTISRFEKGGDQGTADLLRVIVFPQEITHCAAGVKWFSFLCHRVEALSLCSLKCDRTQIESVSGEVCVKQGPETHTSSHVDSRSAEEEDCSLDLSRDLESFGPNKTWAVKNSLDHLVISAFHTVVRSHFRGKLKPPFNEAAREAAGFSVEWYKPLAC